MAAKLLFSLLSIISLLHAANSSALSLLHSDHRSLSIINSHLNLTTNQHPCSHYTTKCNTTSLRITQLIFGSDETISGTLSPAIGNLSDLEVLFISGNDVSGTIPAEISSCRKIEVLWLRENRFSGDVPKEISLLVRLRVLALSYNRFTGDLNFLNFLPNLEVLELYGNLFSGKVPDSVKSFRNLKNFDPSDQIRDLTDQVPKRYVFTEEIQTSSIALAPAVSPGTSSDKALAPALATNTTAKETQKHKKKHKKNPGKMTLGFFAGAVGGILSGGLFIVLFKLVKFMIRGREKEMGPTIYSPLIKRAEDLAFLETEEGVSSLEIIGKGGCGEVYKAELPGSNGKVIAIKKIVQPSKETGELSEEDTKSLNKFMRQVKSEIQTVGHIRHRNLVPLLAHVARPDCQFLVYEFMKNGSLQDLLCQSAEGTRELDWITRHNIALGVASGLEYLHTSHNPRIIHRDLKPANILLGDDMEAKIADFGLAKAMPNMDTHVSTSNVAGTVGYIAPEYHQTLKFTDKCDVYSFGVVLGVLVIGKLPSDDFFQHTSEMSLVRWMRNVMTSEDPTVAIDPKLTGNGYEEQMLLVLKIACFCTLDDARQRPNSKDIRCMLSQIVH